MSAMTVETIPHMTGCRCGRGQPARMVDERRVLALTSEYGDALLGELVERLQRSGVAVLRTSTPRRNDEGKRIGPECLIRSCEVLEYWRLVRNVEAALSRSVERTRGTHRRT